jgi:hypothetical protein
MERKEKRVPEAGESAHHQTWLQKVKLVNKKTDNGTVYTFARSDPNKDEYRHPGRPHHQLQPSQVTEVSPFTWVGSLKERTEASLPDIGKDVQRLGR